MAKSPSDVFTPHAADINKNMYVERADLQSGLQLGLQSGFNLVVHGESGSRKTWLYKGVLNDLGIPFVTANLANASRFGSIGAELRNIIKRLAGDETVSKSREFEIDLGKIFKRKWAKKIDSASFDPFEALLRSIYEASSGKKSILVLDNLEAIVHDEKLMDELGNLVLLLDDGNYSQYKVTLLIVGVQGEIKEYFSRTRNLKTVANRLREISEVSRMTMQEAADLIQRGFCEELRYKLFDVDTVTKHICWMTDRLPQRLHEYGLELANIAQGKKEVEEDMLEVADLAYLKTHLYENVAVVENLMNRQGTKIGRRNQTLYTLGKIDGEEFDKSAVEDLLRKEFLSDEDTTILNIPGILADLASGQKPVLRRASSSRRYRFADPRYRMCLRAMLKKTEDGKVVLTAES